MNIGLTPQEQASLINKSLMTSPQFRKGIATQHIVKYALSRGWIQVSEQPVLTKRGTPRKRNWWRGHPVLR